MRQWWCEMWCVMCRAVWCVAVLSSHSISLSVTIMRPVIRNIIHWSFLIFLLYLFLLTTSMSSVTSHEMTNRKEWKMNGWGSIIANQAYSLILPAGLFLNKKLLQVRGCILLKQNDIFTLLVLFHTKKWTYYSALVKVISFFTVISTHKFHLILMIVLLPH